MAYATPRITAPDWLPSRAIVQGLGWGILGLAVVWRWRQRGPDARLGPRLAALACASCLALHLAAAQLVPAWEYAADTLRPSDDLPGRIYGFCVEPYRLLEAVWPDAWGRFGPENRSWIQALPPAGERLLWTPSLYIGGLTLMLAVAGLGFFRRGFAMVVHRLADLALARRDRCRGRRVRQVRWTSLGGSLAAGCVRRARTARPAQRLDRVDGFLHDGAGSVYGLMAWVLPGFSLFRYPAKLLPFAALALAVLAGLGWERLAAGQTQVPQRWGLAGLAVTLAALVLIWTAQAPILTWLTRQLPAGSEFGPVDPLAAPGCNGPGPGPRRARPGARPGPVPAGAASSPVRRRGGTRGHDAGPRRRQCTARLDHTAGRRSRRRPGP